MKYSMGIDVGTHQSKGVLVNELGNVVLSVSTSHPLLNPKPNYFEHDADKHWWNDVCYISKKLIQNSNVNPEDISAIGISALGADCLPVDKDGKPLRNAILYGIDARATDEIDWLNDHWKEDRIHMWFGRPLCSSDVLPKILWIKRNEPEIYMKTHKFLTASSYLTFKLTNEYVIDRFLGLASFKPAYDSVGEINQHLINEICHRDQLATMKFSHEVVGYVTKEASEQTGLSTKTKVIVGTDDSGAEAISCGIVSPKDTFMQLGSTMYLIVLTENQVIDSRLWNEPYIVPGVFDISAGTNTSGSIIEWAKRELYSNIENEVELYAKINEDLSNIEPLKHGLLVLPYFAGERTPIHDPMAKGCILGLTLSSTKQEILYALVEGVCLTIAHHFEILDELSVPTNRIIVAGGGTNNETWMQLLSNMLQKELHVPKVSIGACYGDALMALMASGIIKDYHEIHKYVEIEKSYSPDLNLEGFYSKKLKLFKSLYNQTKGIMTELS